MFKDKYSDLISEPLEYIWFDLSNEGDLQHLGGEFSITWKPGRWDLRVNYMYLDSDAEKTTRGLPKINGLSAEMEKALYARHSGALYAIYNWSKELSTSVAYYGNSAIESQSYDRFDFTVTKKWQLACVESISVQYNLRHHSEDVSAPHGADWDRLYNEMSYEPRVRHFITGLINF